MNQRTKPIALLPPGTPSFDLGPDRFLTALSNMDHLSTETKQAIINRYTLERAYAQRERRSKAQIRRGWTDLISPLSYEANNVHSAIRYYETFKFSLKDGKLPEDPALPVLRDYHAVLARLLRMFKDYRSNLTPMSEARTQFEALLPEGKTLPNHGEHWTDWIAPGTKRRIETAFLSIPHKPKAKRRVPFERIERPENRVNKKDKRSPRRPANVADEWLGNQPNDGKKPSRESVA